MKLKPIVTSALVISAFFTGSVIILGLASNKVFFYIYFIFVLFWMGVLIYNIRGIFKSRSDFIVSTAFLIAASFFLTLFVNSIDNYLDEKQEFAKKMNIISDINSMEDTNTQYFNYIEYLNEEVNNTARRNEQLMNQIVALRVQLKALEAQQQIPPEPIVQEPVVPIVQEPIPYYDDDYGEDDGESEDD